MSASTILHWMLSLKQYTVGESHIITHFKASFLKTKLLCSALQYARFINSSRRKYGYYVATKYLLVAYYYRG